nr:DUF3108 domain-containing protein [uncultured Desulfuromonas sp.]
MMYCLIALPICLPLLLMAAKHRFFTLSKMLILSVFLIHGGAALATPAQAAAYPPGEVLHYVLKWGVIPAGKATLSVEPLESVDGTLCHHFVLQARTNDTLDVFFKVRDRIDAFAQYGLQRSHLYRKKQQEGRHKKDVVVRFDWQQGTATYRDKDKEKKPIDLLPGSLDPLSAFYALRNERLVVGEALRLAVTDGKKNVLGEARVIRKETITIADRAYPTILVEPDLKQVGGVFKKSKDAKIQVWLTDDERRIPVRLKSKVYIGSFIADLIDQELPAAMTGPSG